MQITPLSQRAASEALDKLRRLRPLVHCLTNDVVQEITANVLLAAGASPAMVVAEEEAPYFAGIAGALLVNVGTPVPERLKSMQLSARRPGKARALGARSCGRRRHPMARR